MKKGPNRKTVPSEWIFLNKRSLPSLGKVGRVDFEVFPAAEAEILREHARYLSHREAIWKAPDVALLRDRATRAIKTATELGIRLRDFLEGEEDALDRLAIKGAVSSLLDDHDLSMKAMSDAFEETQDLLRRSEMYLSAILIALDGRDDSLEIASVSAPSLRAELYRRLFKVIQYHGLDVRLGETSLIVQLVLRLDGRDPGPTSSLESTKQAERDQRRRKDLALEIKQAVKAPKGG